MLLPQELMELIRQGEGLHVEFKKSVKDVTKDVYDTVCSFSNRDGGHIFLGVSDDGTIIGVDKDRVERMKKDFVNTINNESKIYPPLYLTPEEYESEGATVIHVYVPSGRTVYRKAGRILAGLATGASLLCYYKALQDGDVSKVVPIDKLSIVLTLILAFVFLHEDFTWKAALGSALITAGTLVMVL